METEVTKKRTLIHPLTGVEFQSEHDLAESLLKSYQKVKVQQAELTKDEGEIIVALQAFETKKVEGLTLYAEVKPRENVSYENTETGDKGLEYLISQYGKDILPLLRVEYKESGQKVAKFLDAVEKSATTAIAKGSVLSLDDKYHLEMVAAIKKLRKVSFGKPEITLRPLPLIGAKDDVSFE